MLDPLLGVTPVDDPALFAGLVSSSAVRVCPVYESDVSVLNPVGGSPAVNALGERRGLLAVKFIGVGSDPDGPSGSMLPNLVIEIADPSLIDIGELIGSGRAVLVH